MTNTTETTTPADTATVWTTTVRTPVYVEARIHYTEIDARRAMARYTLFRVQREESRGYITNVELIGDDEVVIRRFDTDAPRDWRVTMETYTA